MGVSQLGHLAGDRTYPESGNNMWKVWIIGMRAVGAMCILSVAYMMTVWISDDYRVRRIYKEFRAAVEALPVGADIREVQRLLDSRGYDYVRVAYGEGLSGDSISRLHDRAHLCILTSPNIGRLSYGLSGRKERVSQWGPLFYVNFYYWFGFDNRGRHIDHHLEMLYMGL
jgi:hypothetical protein